MTQPEDDTAEAVATEATTTNHDHDDEEEEEDLPEAVAEIETEAVAAAEECKEQEEAAHSSHSASNNSAANNNNFSSVDLIKAYILNHTAGITTTAEAAARPSTYATEDLVPMKDSNINPFSSVSTFTMNNLGSMSSLFGPNGGMATTDDDVAAMSTAAAVASLGDNSDKMDRLRDIMEKKMPKQESSSDNNITMIPLVYSAGSDRQEAASPSELDKLSRALQPKSKFKTSAEANAASSSSKKRKEKSPAIKNFIEGNMTEKDVLMGRGGRSNHHPGNSRYLEAKLTIQPRYRKATKEEKTGISQELVDIVKAWGGRFLKLDDASQRWYEVDTVTARKKASQTLREENTADSRAQKRAKYSHKGNGVGGGGGGGGSTRKSKTGSAAMLPLSQVATGVPMVVVEDVVTGGVETIGDGETAITTTDHTTNNEATTAGAEPPVVYQQTDV